MHTSHIPVLIIGAGPVGMATAALLRQQGIAVRIIEKNEAPTQCCSLRRNSVMLDPLSGE
jgi:2-polyprenyl-6-methoxyphenol hydroxylase-like FAD-dependent oxidoreductase